MQCTGYSVIQGTTISSFDVTVLDVAAGEAAGIGRILFQVSGPAVDATGIGPGFSGSPIYCPDGAGVSRVIGAISRVDQRVRRQGRAGDADRRDPRHAGRRAAAGRRAGDASEGERERLSPRMRAAIASAQADRVAVDRERVERAARECADEGGREGRAGRCWRCRRGRSGASPRRRCGRARRWRSGTRTATCARARSAPSRTSTATASGSSATSSRATAGARCCCRTPTSSGSSTTRCSSGAIALDLQARRLRATTSGRSPSDGFSAVAGRHRRAAAHRADRR